MLIWDSIEYFSQGPFSAKTVGWKTFFSKKNFFFFQLTN